MHNNDKLMSFERMHWRETVRRNALDHRRTWMEGEELDHGEGEGEGERRLSA
jgi:hypothetical protein